MLVIRAAQLDVWRQSSVDAFTARAVQRLASVYPDAYAKLGDDGARALVARAIDTGARHGIDTEGGVSALVDLMVQVGERFERSPHAEWARKILAHPKLPGELKIQALVGRIAAATQGRIVEPA
jgi:hypothetical protein